MDTDLDWNRKRLIETLRWVASPAKVQRAAVPAFAMVEDEIVQSIENEVVMLPTLKSAGWLSEDEENAVRTVNAAAKALLLSTGWDSTDSLETAAEWESLRNAAKAALLVFKAEYRPPLPGWV